MESMGTAYSKVAETPSGSAFDDLRPRENVIHGLCKFPRNHIQHRPTYSSYTGAPKTPKLPMEAKVIYLFI